MSSRRSKLFLYLRVFFFLDLFLLVAVFSFWFFTRSSRRSLIDLVERQFAHNLALSSQLAFANDVLTNRYFSAASSFASNVWASAYFFVASNSVASSSVSSFSVSSDSSSSDLPPLDFSGYFEVNGIPHIRLRNSFFKKGDFVLGYPIEDISPDVVQYRGKFFKVLQNEK